MRPSLQGRYVFSKLLCPASSFDYGFLQEAINCIAVLSSTDMCKPLLAGSNFIAVLLEALKCSKLRDVTKEKVVLILLRFSQDPMFTDKMSACFDVLVDLVRNGLETQRLTQQSALLLSILAATDDLKETCIRAGALKSLSALVTPLPKCEAVLPIFGPA